MRNTAVILAAGKGRRMGTDVPKQYLKICGKPVLAHTIDAFERSSTDDIVIVCGLGEEDFVRREIVNRYGFTKIKAIVTGGEERYDSACRGVEAALEGENPEDTIVLIHDGVRACVEPALIDRVIYEVRYGHVAVVPGVESTDTIRIVDSDNYGVRTPMRQTVRRIQTPQGFLGSIIMKGYEGFKDDPQADAELITDDAMLVEKYTSYKVYITKGSKRNLKLTCPADFEIAKGILMNYEKQRN